LIIGDDITITVLGVSDKTVKLGIDAPADIAVDRSEIRSKKERGRQQTGYLRMPITNRD